MEQSELVALLGRPLTPGEVTNLALYLEIAQESLEELLGISISKADNTTRTFPYREGYRTVFADVFRSVSVVKVDGETVDSSDYHSAQWDKRNAPWSNSIVFGGCQDGTEVEITADWGFDDIPNDLKRLWAQLFANVSKKYSAGPKVQSKQVEDFRVTYSNSQSADELFLEENRRTIEKYRLCNVGDLRHGHRRVRSVC